MIRHENYREPHKLDFPRTFETNQPESSLPAMLYRANIGQNEDVLL